MKTKYSIYRKWPLRGWLNDFETSSVKIARQLIQRSIATGWKKEDHRLVKTSYQETQIGI